MPTPTTTNPVSIVPAPLAQPDIDALISLVKWGGPLGSGVQLTYSFPWEGGAASWFAGYGGAAYSLVSENTAAQHFGLDAQQQAAFRSALQVWSNVANVVFAQVPDNATSAGDIRVGFSTAVPAGTWGWAYFPKGDWPNGGDIWISPQAAAGAGDWSAGSYNYLSLIHELGHALGLKHPFADGPVLPDAQDNLRDTVMSYTEPDNLLYVSVERDGSRYSLSAFNVQPTTPMVLDIAAIQYLYGANMTYRTGDDIYTFDRATPILQALWDAGGDDTISVANFSRGCEIDLRPGHYSVVYVASDAIPGVHWEDPPPVPTYDGSPNLGIAFGCDIENAIVYSGLHAIWSYRLAHRLWAKPAGRGPARVLSQFTRFLTGIEIHP
ncbi:MAG: matrixin family metalloprotease, partial [Pseudomonadota bacterium]